MNSTMHWSAEKLYFYLHQMHSMGHETFQNEFRSGSMLDEVTHGVMDVMFAAACYSPVMGRIGTLFWPLAREIIRLRVEGTDQLNLVLWFGVIPQTVLVLEPKTYILDSMVPPILSDISIEGSVPLGSIQCESWELESCARTVLEIPGNSSLVFVGNVRVTTLLVRHLEVLSGPSSSDDAMLKFHGSGDQESSLIFDRVMLTGSGCSVVGYEKVHCNQLSVSDAVVGFEGRNIHTLSFTGSINEFSSQFLKSGCLFCDHALRLFDVCSLFCSGQFFENNKIILYVQVRKTCVFENSVMVQCDHMGEILCSPGCSPSFFKLKVYYSFIFLLFLVDDFFLQIDPSISRFLTDGDGLVCDNNVIFSSTTPRYLSCSCVYPEEI